MISELFNFNTRQLFYFCPVSAHLIPYTFYFSPNFYLILYIATNKIYVQIRLNLLRKINNKPPFIL